MKRIFEIHIDTGDDDVDENLSDAFIELLGHMEGITYKFVY